MTNAILATIALSTAAQDMAAKRDQKLKEPFFSKAAWVTDYDKAREESKKSGKLIFAYFTRSYAG
jgi:hypothetical protein